MPNKQRNGSTWEWRKLRAAILKRDGYICWMCGQPGADTVDHLIPYAIEPNNNWANLAAAHGRKRPEYGCQGNYSRGAQQRHNARKPKRKPLRVPRGEIAAQATTGPQKTDSGETAPLWPCAWAANPSPSNPTFNYQSSKPVQRQRRDDDASE